MDGQLSDVTCKIAIFTWSDLSYSLACGKRALQSLSVVKTSVKTL